MEFHKTFKIRISAGRPVGKPISPAGRFFLAGVGIFLLWLNGNQFWHEYLLYHYGAPWQAKVTSTYWTSGKGGPRYRARYSFTLPSGVHVGGRGAISRATYSTLKPGDPLGIRYVPADPRISEPAELSFNVRNMTLAAVFFPVSLSVILIALRRKADAPPENNPSPGLNAPTIIR